MQGRNKTLREQLKTLFPACQVRPKHPHKPPERTHKTVGQINGPPHRALRQPAHRQAQPRPSTAHGTTANAESADRRRTMAYRATKPHTQVSTPPRPHPLLQNRRAGPEGLELVSRKKRANRDNHPYDRQSPAGGLRSRH